MIKPGTFGWIAAISLLPVFGFVRRVCRAGDLHQPVAAQRHLVLFDTFSGTCSGTACSAQTTNTQLLYPFTLSNTSENVDDGTLWQLAVRCSDGTQMAFASRSSAPSLENGVLQGAGTTCSTSACTAAGSISR